MGKSEIVASILDNALVRRVWSATDRRRGMLRILAYHRVLDDNPETFPFDEALISADSCAFRQQMEFARRHFEVMSFADLARCEDEGRAWPARAALVTFDDGYADNYTHAFPILKDLKLPATIFIATSYMSNGQRLFWWDLVAYCVKHTPHHEANLPQIHHQAIALASGSDKHKAILRILYWVKRAPEAIKNEFLDQLPTTLAVDLPANLAHGMHLTWEQVKEMAAGGIEFGSHSVTHPILANVTLEQLQDEMCESKKIIEGQLGREVITIAYPDGRKPNYNEKVQQIAADCGFRYALSYEEGPTLAKNCDYFAMPRIHVEQDQSPSRFRANMMWPDIMHFRRNSPSHATPEPPL